MQCMLARASAMSRQPTRRDRQVDRPAHHHPRLDDILVSLIGVPQLEEERVDDPAGGQQRQQVQHRVDVILHHETAQAAGLATLRHPQVPSNRFVLSNKHGVTDMVCEPRPEGPVEYLQ
jgi:hypothetical protein